jgi:hypothetical protein
MISITLGMKLSHYFASKTTVDSDDEELRQQLTQAFLDQQW